MRLPNPAIVMETGEQDRFAGATGYGWRSRKNVAPMGGLTVILILVVFVE